jgi:Flp pilus assembly protein TadB
VHRESTSPDMPTAGDIVRETVDLGGGLAIVLLPLYATALPGVLLFIVAPAVLLLALVAAPVVLVAALVAPPYLLVRLARRRRGRRVQRHGMTRPN